MEPDVRRALVGTFVARLSASAALRVVYPFLPEIARGLNVTPAHVSSVVAVRNLGALTSPLSASASDRWGRRTTMIVAMLSIALASVVTIISGHFVLAAIGLTLVGVARPAFDISMQAWFADRVPYVQRGRVYGISELNWSLSLLVVPVAAYLIVIADWRSPFIFLALLSLVGAGAVAISVQPDRPARRTERIPLRPSPTLVRALVAVALFNLAAEAIFVVYGQWLEGPLGLSVTGIGIFTLVILVAEFVGAGVVAWVADAFGLKRMWMVTLLATSIIYLGFPLVGNSVLGAVVIVAVWITTYEMAYVTSVPFISEMSSARAGVLSTLVLSVGVGRAFGALVAQPLFSAGGISLSAGVAGAFTLLALLMLIGVPEHAASIEPSGPPRPPRTLAEEP